MQLDYTFPAAYDGYVRVFIANFIAIGIKDIEIVFYPRSRSMQIKLNRITIR